MINLNTSVKLFINKHKAYIEKNVCHSTYTSAGTLYCMYDVTVGKVKLEYISLSKKSIKSTVNGVDLKPSTLMVLEKIYANDEKKLLNSLNKRYTKHNKQEIAQIISLLGE